MTDAASTPSEGAKAAAAQEALLLLTIDHLQHYWAADGRWEVRGGYWEVRGMGRAGKRMPGPYSLPH